MTVVDVATLLAEGLAAHQAGRLSEAEACYRRALTAQPEQPEALHLLGVVALQSDRGDEARALVQRAVIVAPSQPTFWNTLGAIERAANRLDAAAAAFSRATELAPTYAEAWANLATVHELRADRSAEAVALAGLTTALPTHARAWGRRGVLAYQTSQLDEAHDCFAEATRLDPNDPEAWTNLGAVQLRLGRLDEAEVSQRRAVALRPGFVDGLNNLGNVLVARACWTEAATILEQVVQQAPQNPNGWINLGHALKGLDRYQEACVAYEQVLSLSPDLPVALIGLGDALQGLGDLRRAVDCYEKARSLTPDEPDLYEHLGVAYQTLGRLDEAAAAFRHCLALDPDRSRVQSGLIFVLDLQEGAEAEAWEERRHWNARYGQRTGATAGQHTTRTHTNNSDPDRPLRIGYVSADFRHHSAAYLVLPVIASHDRSHFTAICYSGVLKADEVTARFRALADVWHDTADLSDDGLEALIRADEIDVLVDLSGHSGGNRLTVFAREPAPVQVTAWGYATGTGLDAMQFFLADPVAVPPEARRYYAEEIVDLPSLFCYEPPAYTPPVAPLPAAERGYVTFGAFNRMEKVSPGTRDAWARILTRVPDSRLMVKTLRHDTDPACHQLVDDLAARGVDRARIEVRDNGAHAEHLAAHAEIDILLDTFPHGGGVTSVEALLMGVPVVTLLGDRVAGRLAASCLTTLKMDDLIASTADEYVSIAARLAGDLDRLADERATLRQRVLGSPLAHASLYTRTVEATYRDLWTRWCSARGTSEATKETR